MDQLKAMRIFVRVADAGSFAAASRALCVAPAVVTRAVADLERQLGARLMTRTTRRLALTDIGRRYLERLRTILGEIDDAAALASAAQARPSGLVRLRAAPSFAVGQLGARLARFRSAHPQVAVEVSASGPVESIDDEHDLTILVQREPLDGRFVARRLARTEIIACAQPAYLERADRPRHPHDLAAHALLVPANLGPRRPLAFVHRATGESVALPGAVPALRTSNHDLNHAGALAGLGITGLPSYMAQKDLCAGRLERVLPGWRLFDMTIWACMPTRLHLPASTRAFMDFLLAEFGGADRDLWPSPVAAAGLPAAGPATAFVQSVGRALDGAAVTAALAA